MKPYSIGLLTMAATLALAMAAYSQETIKMTATNDNSMQAGTTNISDKTEEYLNPGEPIKVKVGQRFTIRMESNPTTGYGWQLSKDLDNIIVLITNTFIPPDSKLCGAGGHELWTFKAVEQGQTNILMKYVRPWEKDQPARTNVFMVIVK